MDRKELNALLKSIISSFDLKGETLTSLKQKIKLNYEGDKIIFRRKVLSKEKQQERIRHYDKLSCLRLYANEKAVEKYMVKEGYKFEDIYNILALDFIIYKKEIDIFEYLKDKFPTEWGLFDFEDLGNGYMLAYN